MSAAEKITKIGIVAGGGDLPHALARSCIERGLAVFMVGLDGHCGPIDPAVPHIYAKVGKAGAIMRRLHEEDVADLVLIGSLKRPNWSELVPDFKTLKFIGQYGLSAGGDDDLLTKLRRFLAGEGFTLHGVHRFMPELLAPAGVLGVVQPDTQQAVDIEAGFAASQDLGARDAGQAVVVLNGAIIAEEDERGTDALIKRCADHARGAVLVKSCKPQQDMDLDLPTVGLKTVKAAHAAGFSGVALHAGKSLLMDKADVIAFADAQGMFIVGHDG